jgi:hypothetical protein
MERVNKYTQKEGKREKGRKWDRLWESEVQKNKRMIGSVCEREREGEKKRGINIRKERKKRKRKVETIEIKM